MSTEKLSFPMLNIKTVFFLLLFEGLWVCDICPNYDCLAVSFLQSQVDPMSNRNLYHKPNPKSNLFVILKLTLCIRSDEMNTGANELE